eukprot:55525-Prymnesium_polylepis.1
MREKQREWEEEERMHKMAHLEDVLDILCGTGPPPCVCRPIPPIHRTVRLGGNPVAQGVNVIVHSVRR